MKKIDIIIVHYGDVRLTKKALESLEKHVSYRSAIVVNNDTKIVISQKIGNHPKRIFIDVGKNVGFAAGVNIGIKHALESGAEYVVLFNNDAYASSNFILPLTQIFNNEHKAGITAPVIKFRKNRNVLYDTGGSIQKYIGKTYHSNVSELRSIKLKSVAYVSGCCMMIRTGVFEEIGQFDESFFLYYEDVDFCLRARKAGFQILCVPESVVEHDLSSSVGANSSTAIYHLVKSGKEFGRKYRKEFPFHPLFLIYQSAIFFIRSPFSFVSILKGWL